MDRKGKWSEKHDVTVSGQNTCRQFSPQGQYSLRGLKDQVHQEPVETRIFSMSPALVHRVKLKGRPREFVLKGVHQTILMHNQAGGPLGREYL